MCIDDNYGETTSDRYTYSDAVIVASYGPVEFADEILSALAAEDEARIASDEEA